jgi:hypothetical protein
MLPSTQIRNITENSPSIKKPQRKGKEVVKSSEGGRLGKLEIYQITVIEEKGHST